MNGDGGSVERPQVGNARWRGHAARTLALLLWGVNAIGCARGPGPADLEPERLGPSWHPASHAPSADARVPDSPTPRWRQNLGRGATGPLVLGDSVIAGVSLDRYVVALRRDDGERLWRHKMSAPGAGPPLVLGNRVFAASGGPNGRVYAFTGSGRKLWNERLAFVDGPLAVVDSLVLAATESGGVVALATASGEVRWARRVAGASRAGLTALGDHDVLLSTDDSLVRFDARSGTVLARQAVRGTAIAPPALVGDLIVLVTADGHVAALDAADLAPAWTVDLNAPVFGGVAVARDTVFAVSIQGDLWRIPLAHPEAARALSVRAAVRAAPSPVAGGVLVGTLNGEILLVRGDSILPRGRVTGPVDQPALAADGILYVVDGRGRVHAWQ